MSLNPQQSKSSLTVKLASAFIVLSLGRLVEFFPFGLAYILAIVTIVSYALLSNPKNHYTAKEYPELICLIGILTLMVLSVPFSPWPGGSLKFIYTTFLKILIIFYIIIKSATNTKELKTITVALALSGLVYTILLRTKGATVEDWRVSFGYTLDPNDAALLMVTTLPLSFFCYQTSSKYLNFFWLSCVLIISTGVIMTGSRGGFLGFCSVLILEFINFRRRINPRKLMFLFLIILTAVFLASATYWERIGTITGFEADASAQSRLVLWIKGLRFIYDNPVLGIGVTAFPILEGISHRDVGGPWLTAHNSFIQIGAEIGLGGLICFVLLFYFINKRLKNISRNPIEKESKAFLSELAGACRVSLIGFFVCSFFLSQAYSSILYYLIGLSLAVSAVYEDLKSDFD